MLKYKIFPKMIAAAVLGTLAFSAQAELSKIRYVGTWSNLSLYKDFEKPFWSELGKHIDQEVETTVVPFDQMGLNGSEVFRMVAQGTFDVGTTTNAYVLGSAPELEGVEFPMLMTTPEESRKIAELYRPVLAKTAKDRFRDSELLAVSRWPQQGIFCNFPIHRLADLKGKKVRVSGGTHSEFVEALGGSPVNISFSETTGALERKTLDCAVTGAMSAYAVGWHEVATHYLPAPIGGWGYNMTLMNGKVWQSLSDGQKGELKTKIKELFEIPALEAAEQDYVVALNCLSGRADCPKGKSGNMTISELIPEDIELSRKILIEIILPSWKKRVSADTFDAWNKTVGDYLHLEVN
ncbi:TRAP transporter substrate-binding protein [Pusillimonas sp. ANT_WB101]|uniref:TRAP transporter substrate-binding protein n=1 Tax=Pusillimonas sp. ANT_WB101 TaxID=2597356 RepID=UPI0011EFA593|nr:TRAP transporter substrate-binding protein [Pusillimonas sp. ANT_WB101]KAA0892564.1 TRAP transporter substrate-binding protein [Pusillimonas sp. ANT_WB101]